MLEWSKCSITRRSCSEMTSSAAFRCVQAWLLEKPAAWTDEDAPCLAAALMAQRPSTKRPREDALLEAERSHQRRRIELLEEQLLGEEAEVRRLEEQAASTDLEEIMSEVSHVSAALQAPATRSQRAELALRWFEAHDTWSGRWDAWDAVLDHGGPPEPPARPDAKKLVSEWRAELSRDVE